VSTLREVRSALVVIAVLAVMALLLDGVISAGIHLAGGRPPIAAPPRCYGCAPAAAPGGSLVRI
jgi:hypothetical protein